MKKRMYKNNGFLLSFFAAFFIVLSYQSASAAPPVKVNWAEIEQLIKNQQLTLAQKRIDSVLEKSIQLGDEKTWRESLLLATSMRFQNNQFETAVDFLRSKPWPKDQDSQLILNLHLAEFLSRYINRYRWEISNRETISSKNALPLKKQSLAQLVDDVNQFYFRSYQLSKNRNEPIESLGGLSLPSLKNIFVKTDYPKDIRGGVLDTVTYLWVDFLSNSSLWSPSHSNETSNFTVSHLIAYPQGVRVEDKRIHPLKRIMRLLSDLEAYKNNIKMPEAGLEAFRVKIKKIRNHQNLNAIERGQLINHLGVKLKQELVSSLPWANILRADLARLVQESNEPDSNIKALAILNQCVSQFKTHKATEACLYQREQLLLPTLSMVSMKTDGLGKRSIQLRHKNIDKLHFKAWKLTLDQALKADKHKLIRSLLSSGKTKPVFSWVSSLPATTDYKPHTTYITPPINQMGYWLIAASTKSEVKIGDKNTLISSVSLNTSRLLIDAKSTEKEYKFTVYQGESGQLAGKVQVELWGGGYNALKRIASKFTTGDGQVSFPMQKRGSYKVVAKYGNDFVILDRLTSYYKNRINPFSKSALIFTDRAIYRPTQKIKWKVVAYAGNSEDGEYKILPHSAGWVKLLDTNGKQVEILNVKTNQYGSASGEFTAKAGLLLGQWSIETSWAMNGRVAGTRIKVEEYKRPTFTAEVSESGIALSLGKVAKIEGSAKYYFGQPVTDGKVKWKVERSQQVIRPYWGGYRGYSMPYRGKEIIKSGEASLNKTGKFSFNFTPKGKLNADKNAVNYRYTVTADITDSGGETRTATRSFTVGSIAIQARVDSEIQFLSEGKPHKLEASRYDLNNIPRSGNAYWSLHRVSQPKVALMPSDLPVVNGEEGAVQAKAFFTPGDKLNPRWQGASEFERYAKDWKDAEKVAQGTLSHNKEGEATINVKALAVGVYRMHYTTKDNQGKAFKLQKMLIVGGQKASPIKVPLMLKVKENTVEVGDEVSLLAGSSYDKSPVIMEVFKGDKLLRRNLYKGGIKQLKYPVTKADKGSLTFVLTLVKDYQVIQKRQQVTIPWTDKSLKVAFSTFRDKLRPGQKETWRVTVKDANGDALSKNSVELLASMFDKSLEFFGKHNPASVNSLYPSHTPHYIRRSYSVGQAYGIYQQSYSRKMTYPKRYQPVSLFLIDNSGGVGVEEAPVVASPAPRMMRAPAPKMAPTAVSSLQMKAVAGEMNEESESDLQENSTQEIDDITASSLGLGEIKLRKNFNETAFFYPHLILDEKGSVAFEFEVPESLTEWKVWLSAISKDMKGGSATKFARTSKEMMVRPYLPRFLRSGDKAEIEVVVNNTSDKNLSGKLEFDVIDPETKETIAKNFKLTNTNRDFSVEAGQSSRLRFSISAPKELGLVAIRARAKATNGAESFDDGEQRPLPILPSRIHLSQSRFVALQGNTQREMIFNELADDKDATRVNDSLVVTVDGQLFYSTLKALPYLVDYPYECTEQTMNRFLSTSIISSVFENHPAIASMATKMSDRKTRLEDWQAVDNDPNRKMLLEETPWLRNAQGGSKNEDDLIRVLDPEVARSQYDKSLTKLLKAQSSSGGFPWWEGGRPSAYMTVYMLHGFSRALEFKVDVPKASIQKAWRFLHSHYKDELKAKLKNSENLHLITLINYVLSAYPDNSWSANTFTTFDIKEMTDISMRKWQKLPPLLKAYLALTLERGGRNQEADLVFASIMDSAKTDKDLGTYFAPEDRSWLWYNDSVDSHAFILRAMMELNPNDQRRHGLVQWLMLNKKLNHWKSTRATAESIYALVYYLDKDDQLSKDEKVSIKIGADIRKELLFKANEFTGGKNQVVVPSEEIKPEMASIKVSNDSKSLMFASATWNFSTDMSPKSAQGDFFEVSRKFYKRVQKGKEIVLQPLSEGSTLQVGDELEVQLSLRAKHVAEFIHLRAPRGAGFEPVNQGSGYRHQTGLSYYEETRDSGTNFFFERLPAGEYSFKYRLRSTTAGSFRVSPASVQSIYAPEFNAYSRGVNLLIK